MWVLNVSSVNDSPERVVWLEPGHDYRLGRAADCEININKKYISSNHLIIKLGDSSAQSSSITPLTLVLESKASTYINDVRYRYNDKTDPVRPKVLQFTDDKIQINFKKGDEIVTLSLNWIPFTIAYSPNDDMSLRDPSEKVENILKAIAEEFDLKISNGVRSSTDYYLDTPSHNISALSYSLLKLIPVINEEFLWKLKEIKELIRQDFTKFPNLQDFVPTNEMKVDERRQSLFKGLSFITSDSSSADYYRPMIEVAGGEINVLPNTHLDECIKVVEKHKPLVLIQFLGPDKLKLINPEKSNQSILDELGSKLDQKVCRGDDLLAAILKIDTSLLFGSYTRRKASGPVGRRKKQKISRSQIERIDPSSLFIGADSFSKEEPTPGPVEPSVEQIAETVNGTLPKKKRTKVNKIDSSQFWNDLDQNPIIPSQKPAIQDDDVVMSSEPEELVLSGVRKTVPVDIKALKEEVDAEIALDDQNREHLLPDSSRTRPDFVEAIKKIKAEKRLIKKQNELIPDPGDINIQDLILIDKIEVKSHSFNSEAFQSSWNSDWNGRKNYKTFKKIPPKFQNSNSNQANPLLSSTVRYLALEEDREVDPHDDDEEYFRQARKRESDEQKEVARDLFPDTSSRPFFIESDEEIVMPDANSETVKSQPLSRLSSKRSSGQRLSLGTLTNNNEDYDDDDDDDDDSDKRNLKFKFTRA